MSVKGCRIVLLRFPTCRLAWRRFRYFSLKLCSGFNGQYSDDETDPGREGCEGRVAELRRERRVRTGGWTRGYVVLGMMSGSRTLVSHEVNHLDSYTYLQTPKEIITRWHNLSERCSRTVGVGGAWSRHSGTA